MVIYNRSPAKIYAALYLEYVEKNSRAEFIGREQKYFGWEFHPLL